MSPISGHPASDLTTSAAEWSEHDGVFERMPYRSNPDHDSPVVIYFHGRGQSPRTVTRVEPAFAGARLIAPTGGVPLPRATTWFENRRIGVAEPQSLIEAECRFLIWLALHLGETVRPWLCGFSNGGAFAAHLLIHNRGRFSGAALLSAPLVLPPWPDGALAGKPVFYARGTRDKVVPAASFEQAETYLTASSDGEITLRRYEIEHEITRPELADLAFWFERRVTSAISD